MIRITAFQLSLAAVVAGSVLFAGAGVAGDNASIEKMLRARNFYETSAERKFTDDEIKQVEALAAGSKDEKIRVRAQKVLVDHAGKGRGKDEAAVLAAFKYLENNLAAPQVKKLLVEQGFTHYTVAAKGADGSQMFLIEHVSTPQGFNGGLNLRYDPKTKVIVEMKAWGAVNLQ